MTFRLIICCAPILLWLLPCSASAQSADVRQIMREQAASTRVGENRHKDRRRTARASHPKHRKVAARIKPSKIATAPIRYSSPRSEPTVQQVSNKELNAITTGSVGDNRAGQVDATASYGPDAQTMISDAFDAIDRLERERSRSADSGQDAASGSQQGNFFQRMWSGVRNTWRSLLNGS